MGRLIKNQRLLVTCIGKRQGDTGKNYPKYAGYPGSGCKFYRKALIKMNALAHDFHQKIRALFSAYTGIIGEMAAVMYLRRYC